MPGVASNGDTFVATRFADMEDTGERNKIISVQGTNCTTIRPNLSSVDAKIEL
jgi:hypothetical protein